MSKSRKRTAELLSFSGFGKFVKLRIPDVSLENGIVSHLGGVFIFLRNNEGGEARGFRIPDVSFKQISGHMYVYTVDIMFL